MANHYGPINPTIINGMYYGKIQGGADDTKHYFCGACAGDGRWVPLAKLTDGGMTMYHCKKCQASFDVPTANQR